MRKTLKWLAILATLVMFLVMIAGSLVTKTGSALGCGNDWPLCNGKWVPAYTLESLIEYSHRFITGLGGVIVLIFSALAWYTYRGNREVQGLALFGIFFIVVESLLGASAVITPQSSPILALHFGFSLLAFTGVLLLSIFVLQHEKQREQTATVIQPISTGFRRYIWAVNLYAYGVVYLGAYVRHTASSMGCGDWPLCQGKLIPELKGQVGIQFVHRLGAALLFLLIIGLAIYAIRHYRKTRRDIYKAAILATVLITVQVLSGGLVVFYKLNLYVTIFHSMVITCLFGVLSYLSLQAGKRSDTSVNTNQHERKVVSR